MCELPAFVEMLNIQNCVISMGNCVHYMYKMSRFTEKQNSADMLNAQDCANPTGNCVH